MRHPAAGMSDSEIDPAPSATWLAHAREGRLAFQVAPDGTAVFRPRVGAGERWAVSAGLGVVYATCTVRPRDGEPYDVSLIDLDEGFRMMSRVVGVPAAEVAIGARVALEWEDEVPVFRPVTS